MTFEIPVWVLSNVGGFVGFGILSVLFVRGQRNRHQQRVLERIAKKEQEEQLLPVPWKSFYDYLNVSEMSRELILLGATDFERRVTIPTISHNGFEMILSCAGYNLGGNGNCREEFIALFGEYVEFPFEDLT